MCVIVCKNNFINNITKLIKLIYYFNLNVFHISTKIFLIINLKLGSSI